MQMKYFFEVKWNNSDNYFKQMQEQ